MFYVFLILLPNKHSIIRWNVMHDKCSMICIWKLHPFQPITGNWRVSKYEIKYRPSTFGWTLLPHLKH